MAERSKRFDCWNYGYRMSKILGIDPDPLKMDPNSKENIPKWKFNSDNDRIITYQELKKTEFYWDTIEVCLSLMVQGSFRYGRFNDPTKPNWDRISDARKRLELYDQTHNVLHLYDAINMLGLEAEEGKHKDRHFQLIDDGVHTETKC